MNLFCFIFGYIFTAFLLMQPCTPQAVSTQSSQTLLGNFIGFGSVPDKVEDGSVVRVRYQCSRQCQLAVEVVVSALRKTDLVVFRRKWISSTPRANRIHQVLLRLPPSISYQQDFFNRNILNPQNVTVRAWLGNFKNGSEHNSYCGSMLRIYKVLEITPLSERPSKPPTGCPSWSAQLMWQMSRNRIHLCPLESDVIDMLKFPLASTGERFGVVRRFQPFIDRALETARLHAVTQPSVTLSVWIYLLKWCHEENCAIIHHVDRKSSYNTVLIELTDTGDTIIQVHLTTGEDAAFQANQALPLQKWIRLDCYIQDTKVLLDATWDDETRKSEYNFQSSICYDDTDGYFVIGGSRYMPGIRGYFGPTKLYRFGTDEVKNQLDSMPVLLELMRTHQECQEMQTFMKAFLQAVKEDDFLSPARKGVCTPHFERLWGQSEAKKKTSTQAWTWETQLKYSTLYNFLQAKADKIRTGSLHFKHLGATLFEQAVGAMFPVEKAQLKITSKSMAVLQESSCLGNHRASLLLATIHLSGLGHSVNQQQGHVYSLIGASSDDRFALMHAGYKHSQGIDGFPEDLDMAYSYYSNMGAQSSSDYFRSHESKSAAFELFLNASGFGHVAASLEAAWYLSTGNLEGVSQDVKRAVMLQKRVCERNGHLGFMIREALQAYLQGSWQEAFVKYVLAAQTGLGVAQSNVAHLCEELDLGYDCQWRYHNYSILNYDPHPSALLKMGDYYYNYSPSTREESLSLAEKAVSMYGRAALSGSPQGMYNLVVLAQEGHVLPRSVLGLFNVSHRDDRDAVMEKILKRCADLEEEETLTPCSLALLGLQMGKALRRMSQSGAQLLLGYASLLSVLVVAVFLPLQSRFENRPRRPRTSAGSQDGANTNTEQDGSMGATSRAAGNLWLTMNGESWLWQTSDLAVTLSGVCLCAFWTTLLYHLL
ncbi:protein sel-1 homolog 3 isoform 2-T2 [Pholidichthys leucotaenia]